MSDIHFIITGGTIDCVYHPPVQHLVPSESSVLPEYFEDVIKPHFDLSFETVSMLDSRDITSDVREKIVNAVKESACDKIIITHGTDTMTDTIAALDHEDVCKGKTVILVGAMIPLKEFVLSDGGFNLGYALAQVEHLKSGVYICMNAKTFTAGEVQKNVEKARFE